MAHQFHLPLWSRVVFVDWSGVLSDDVFWTSIRKNTRHPLHRILTEASEAFFNERVTDFGAWMRGRKDLTEVVHELDIYFNDGRFPDIVKFLVRRAYEDCAQMEVNAGAMEIVRAVRCSCFLVLATDNTDFFLDTINRLRSKTLASVRSQSRLAHVAREFDDVLCSAALGVLKGEAPEAFFGGWLSSRGLTFSDAVLLDDSLENCRAFASLGGFAIQVPRQPSKPVLEQITKVLEEWLCANPEVDHLNTQFGPVRTFTRQ
jgi:FMN phosphatase YigB (HAD superfamily)